MIFLFNSMEFIYFFIAVFSIYWVLPRRYKNLFLLIASYVFYASWDWRFLSLVLISTFVNYFCGLGIHGSEDKKTKRLLLVLSIVTNLSLLGFFKYFNFFTESLISLLNSIGLNFNFTTLSIILPIGISFYTFQSLSYTIDMYRGKLAPTRNLIVFSLFVSYFPQLIAGPIERARNLIPKIQAVKFLKSINYKEGLYLFIYGLFKKVVIADSVAAIVEQVFFSANPSGAQVLIATYAFAIQIYCDFSGYSNMARGISHFLGIPLSTNFNLPYFARNPSDFWRRWHITLSSWVRDYIYIPLGGRKARLFGMYSLFITMFLMGLWHGAAWNFVLWGVYWFGVIMAYRFMKYFVAKIPKIQNRFLNFFLRSVWIVLMVHVTCYSWIIFRSTSLGQIGLFTKSLISGINFSEFLNASYLYLYAIIVFLVVYEILQFINRDQLFLYKKGFYYQLIFYMVMFFMYVEIGSVFDVKFIYFQF